MSDWIPVQKRLPLQGQRVIVCCGNSEIDFAFVGTPPEGMSLVNYWKKTNGDHIYNVIAWIPVPLPYVPGED